MLHAYALARRQAFAPGKKIADHGKKIEVEFEDCSRAKVAMADCRPFKKSSLKRVVADLTLLDDMAAQLILHNLKKRFEKGRAAHQLDPSTDCRVPMSEC